LNSLDYTHRPAGHQEGSAYFAQFIQLAAIPLTPAAKTSPLPAPALSQFTAIFRRNSFDLSSSGGVNQPAL